MIDRNEVFFDESLPQFVREITTQLGGDVLEQGLVIRDTSGRLRFVSPAKSPPDEERAAVVAALTEAAGSYVREDGVIAFDKEPGVTQLLSLRASEAFPLKLDEHPYWLLDRRIVGSAWVEPPLEKTAWPPTIVFASLKGGVGRTTAIAVTAADLARRNLNVLVVDLDLEAPGLGEMLLDGERMPRYGTVDYLVENGLGGVEDQRVSDFVGTSNLTTAGGGRVDVVPALGKQAMDYPGNILAKLSRAMIEDISPGGDLVSVTVQIAEMVKRIAARDAYDVVLIDSRAGLSELAAPAMLGLGASVLLFGTAQRQTFHGYGALFAALKLLAQRDRSAGRRAEWRVWFKSVHAKASLDASTAAAHRDNLYDLFADNLYDAEDLQQADADAISFDIDDENGPHWPLIIPFTQNFVDFDPTKTPSQLNAAFYEQAYRPFLDGIDQIITASRASREESGNTL